MRGQREEVCVIVSTIKKEKVVEMIFFVKILIYALSPIVLFLSLLTLDFLILNNEIYEHIFMQTQFN